MGPHDPACKDERRGAHAWDPDRLAAKVFNRADLSVDRRLHAQAASMNPAREFHVQPLFNGLEEVHHQVVRDVETSEGKNVLVGGPVALDQLNFETFFFEKAVL